MYELQSKQIPVQQDGYLSVAVNIGTTNSPVCRGERPRTRGSCRGASLGSSLFSSCAQARKLDVWQEADMHTESGSNCEKSEN